MPERIRLSRVKGWRKPVDAVVVARPSRWGNPFKLDMYRADYDEFTDAQLRGMAVSDFRGLIEGRWDLEQVGIDGTYPTVDELRAALRGRDLACWCPLDQPCHADVLMEVANAVHTHPR